MPEETRRAGPLYKRAVEYLDRIFDEYNEAHPADAVLQKEIAFAARMSETAYSQKKRGVRSHFYEDEFEDIARFWRQKTGRPLTGFPHLEWAAMEDIDRRLFGWKP